MRPNELRFDEDAIFIEFPRNLAEVICDVYREVPSVFGNFEIPDWNGWHVNFINPTLIECNYARANPCQNEGYVGNRTIQ